MVVGEKRIVCWNTFGVPFFFFLDGVLCFRPIFCVCFFWRGPFASIHVRIILWTHRSFFT